MKLVTEGTPPNPSSILANWGSQTNDESSKSCYAILEDHPFTAQFISDMLASADMKVQVHLLGAEFLKNPNLFNFKALILDLSLPDLDGLLVMDKLAELSFEVPVLVISGHSEDVIAASVLYGKSIGLNMIGSLHKPFSSAELYFALSIFPQTPL